MLKYVSIFFLAITSFVNTQSDYEFEKFKIEYNKVYKNLEVENNKKKLFYNNLNEINEHNLSKSTYSLKMNEFGDIDLSELFKLNNFENKINSEKKNNEITNETNMLIPNYVDWRKNNVLPEMRNQKKCGSCWAFSALSALESIYAIKYGELISLSKQELVDCSTENYGCNGGYTYEAYDYILKNGICLENEYPYVGEDQVCKFCSELDNECNININIENCNNCNINININNVNTNQCIKCENKLKIKDYTYVTPNNEEYMKYYVAQQPLSVSIEVNNSFIFYDDGIFESSTKEKPRLSHAVIVVGYGSENGIDYWLVMNSWGENWGDKGYIKIRRNVDSIYGTLGIAIRPLFPII